MGIARKAARDLATNPYTAIPFCNEVAIQTNTITVRQLSFTGNVGRAVAVLAKQQDNENKQSLKLWVGEPNRQWRNPPAWLGEFQNQRQESLSKRVEYALAQLQACQTYPHFAAYQSLLSALLQFANVKHSDKFLDNMTFLDNWLTIASPSSLDELKLSEYPIWMQDGWKMLQQLANQLKEIKAIRLQESQEEWWELLNLLKEALKILQWERLADYWTTIADELRTDWLALLNEKLASCLDIKLLSSNTLIRGTQEIKLRVHNPTKSTFEHIHLNMKPVKGIISYGNTICPSELKPGVSKDLSLECTIDDPNVGEMTGILGASSADDGKQIELPFNFPIMVSETVRLYQSPTEQIYDLGDEALTDERSKHFVGRTDLLKQLAERWQQQRSTTLIGQRRIGKTSLLHKIQWESKNNQSQIDYSQIVPVYVDVQEATSLIDFFEITLHNMATTLQVDASKIIIDENNPYKAFKTFLNENRTQEKLQGRYFLLMLDEAMGIFEVDKLDKGKILPEFLRSITQNPDYPIMFLFCGIYVLKRYANLLNVAQFIDISYLSPQESAELLQKPAENILEFGEVALEKAYSLTGAFITTTTRWEHNSGI